MSASAAAFQDCFKSPDRAAAAATTRRPRAVTSHAADDPSIAATKSGQRP